MLLRIMRCDDVYLHSFDSLTCPEIILNLNRLKLADAGLSQGS